MTTAYAFVPIEPTTKDPGLYKLNYSKITAFEEDMTTLITRWAPLKPVIQITPKNTTPELPDIRRKCFGFEGFLCASYGCHENDTARTTPLYFTIICRNCKKVLGHWVPVESLTNKSEIFE